jgi:anaerobic selenocysteine-containing dehydrogenase
MRAHVARHPAWRPGDGRFRLTTLRSEGQFNTVVYEDEDLYRGTTRRDVVLMSDSDARTLGVGEGDPVTVETDAGRLRVVVSTRSSLAVSTWIPALPRSNRLPRACRTSRCKGARAGGK